MKRYERHFKESDLIQTVFDSDSFIKNQYKDELKSIESGIEYCKEQIKHTDENWIKKEYQAVIDDRIKRKNEILSIFKKLNWKL